MLATIKHPKRSMKSLQKGAVVLIASGGILVSNSSFAQQATDLQVYDNLRTLTIQNIDQVQQDESDGFNTRRNNLYNLRGLRAPLRLAVQRIQNYNQRNGRNGGLLRAADAVRALNDLLADALALQARNGFNQLFTTIPGLGLGQARVARNAPPFNNFLPGTFEMGTNTLAATGLTTGVVAAAMNLAGASQFATQAVSLAAATQLVVGVGSNSLRGFLNARLERQDALAQNRAEMEALAGFVLQLDYMQDQVQMALLRQGGRVEVPDNNIRMGAINSMIRTRARWRTSLQTHSRFRRQWMSSEDRNDRNEDHHPTGSV